MNPHCTLRCNRPPRTPRSPARKSDTPPSTTAAPERVFPSDRECVRAGLGANAVLLGHATLYGLVAAGQAGALDVLRLLKDEVDRTLAQIGCASAS